MPNYVATGYVTAGYVADLDTFGVFTFNGIEKTIRLASGTTSITCQDMYSRWADWVASADNNKYLPALDVVGGNALSDTKNLGISYFLDNGWKIQPASEDHTLTVIGNLYTIPAGLSRISYPPGYSISVEFEVSNLVDSSLAQQSEIEYIAFGDGVTVNTTTGTAGTEYPTGTPSVPCSNLADALLIATTRGFNKLFVRGSLTIASGVIVSDKHIYGEGATLNATKTLITLTDGCVTSNTHYHDCRVTGKQGGESNYHDCIIDGLWNAHCHYERCGFILPTANPAYTMQVSSSVGSTHTTYLHECYGDEGTVVIDRNSTGQNQRWDGFTGNIKFINQAKVGGTNSVWMTLKGGTVTIDGTCTTGNFYISGNGTLINNSGGSVVDSSGLVSDLIDGLKYTIESLRDTHQGFGIAFFVDPVSGRDTNPGTTAKTAVQTFARAHDLALAGRGDVIVLLSPGSSVAQITVPIVISKEDLHVRGPGRGFEFKPSTAGLGPVITISANNCSLAGFVVRAATGSTTDEGILVTGKFSKLTKLYVVGSGQGVGTASGIVFAAGDYHEVDDCESEKNGRSGILIRDDQNATNGAPREITVTGGNYYLNGKDGVEFESTRVAGTSNRLTRFRAMNIHDNLGYGIRIDAQAQGTTISEDVLLHNNTLGNVLDSGVNTYNGTTMGSGGASAVDIADAVRAELAPELAQITNIETKATLATMILKNKTVTNPTTGLMTVYADDGVTPYLTAQLYETIDGSVNYRGQGAERREALV